MRTLVTVLVDRIQEIDSTIKALVQDRNTTIAHIELEDPTFKADTLRNTTVVKSEVAAPITVSKPTTKPGRPYTSTKEFRIPPGVKYSSLAESCKEYGIFKTMKSVGVVAQHLRDTGFTEQVNTRILPTQMGKKYIGLRVGDNSLKYYDSKFIELMEICNIKSVL